MKTMSYNRLAIVLMLFAVTSCVRTVNPPEPYGACPTPQQVEWQKMEMNMFCHFGPNTFSDKEWGDGTEVEDLFYPTDMDCSQWAKVAKQSGMGGIIITAKHHDGFCLWPNPQSSHTVAQSSWKNGKGDVLAELSRACTEAGIGMGLYISPWDRNAPTYGSDAYNETFRLTLEDALSRYGTDDTHTLFEQWFDGANGEGPNGKRQNYDWNLFNSTVNRLQPTAVIFSDVGPGCRWVGNESGAAGETCWSTINTDGYAPGSQAPSTDTLNQGCRGGKQWVPAECDVSIRPGWFYHPNEVPKSLNELLQIYYNSVGRNALLLLNVPPDRRGRIAAIDSLRLMELRRALDSIFSNDLARQAEVDVTNQRGGKRCKNFDSKNMLDGNFDSYWVTDDTVLTPTITLTFKKPVTFNRVMLQEFIPLGQRIASFHVDIKQTDGEWKRLVAATTIGYKRILLTPMVTTTALRIVIDEADACPTISNVSLFLDNITQK